jgi:hypothetical protein
MNILHRIESFRPSKPSNPDHFVLDRMWSCIFFTLLPFMSFVLFLCGGLGLAIIFVIVVLILHYLRIC